MCVAHKICEAGEWTTNISAVSDTTCVACKADTFREKGPTDTAVEVEAQVCKPHKICSAGQWTKAVGTTTKDTECIDCDVGTWREVAASTSNPAEAKNAVCKPHSRCSAGEWTKAAGSLPKLSCLASTLSRRLIRRVARDMERLNSALNPGEGVAG